ncbi:hypothetical protein [Leucobacter komagatae]|uniref:Uncharacterized protein n=1 Tax=Leucobacter komagatae TaxID=55969 RepID=A0A0D0H2T5_9MICO|nr:hypothetical protein [Leucobacter komagatae]KIP51450.1 hypothetical protein SD72_15340 [Leucobacter komagatae]
MTDHTAQEPGMNGEQSEQLPSLADRPLEEIESVAEILVEVRTISSQLTPEEVRTELRARLERAGIHLPSNDLDELVTQLAPSPIGGENQRP